MKKHVFLTLNRRVIPSVTPKPRQFSCLSSFRAPPDSRDLRNTTNDFDKRVAKLSDFKAVSEYYPRIPPVRDHIISIRDITKFKNEWSSLELKETHVDNLYTLSGRVLSVRSAGSKLVFLDISRNGQTLQALCNLNTIIDKSEVESDPVKAFKAFAKVIRKGDWCMVTGFPHRSPQGELSVLVSELPTLLAPSLHQIPEVLQDAETRSRQRHVDMLVNEGTVQTLLVRSEVDQALNEFLARDGFTKVQTPLLTAGAGGAVARPFETEATELPGNTLNLRIAPELWLKRLVVGGMDRVYEVGPAFRNEGVDATHNPEFTICEFYAAFAELEWLMQTTEALLQHILKRVTALRDAGRLRALNPPDQELLSAGGFQRLDFISILEREGGFLLPDLDLERNPDSVQQLLAIFEAKSIPVPSRPTLPRLLDALAAHFLEPLCNKPTFIINHPAALSPLSKHFRHPSTTIDHVVSARAELFINGTEYANMYEEENSPFEQRRKFNQQLEFQRQDGEGDGRNEVDESYLHTLEWGLPPTGGWGCGVDRLVMLMSGRQRLSDVLAFGSLRNVVGLGTAQGAAAKQNGNTV